MIREENAGPAMLRLGSLRRSLGQAGQAGSAQCGEGEGALRLRSLRRSLPRAKSRGSGQAEQVRRDDARPVCWLGSWCTLARSREDWKTLGGVKRILYLESFPS